MLKKLSLLLSALVITGSFAGCASGKGSSISGPVKLTAWQPEASGKTETQGFKDSVTEFNKAYKGK